MEANKDKFNEYLRIKGLADSTMKVYLCYYDLFAERKISQESINGFLGKHNSKVSRAFISILLKHFKRSDIEIPKITGRIKKRILKVLSKEQVHLLIEGMNSRRDKLMLALTWEGGLRVSELVGITPMSFCWKKWKNDSKKTSGTLRIIGKGNKERKVFVSIELMNTLYEYTRGRCYNIGKDESLFGISVRRWEQLMDKAGMRVFGYKINPHLIRHSTATYLLENGWNIKEVQDYLGHDSIMTTQKYLHLNDKKQKAKFDDVFNS